MDAWKSNVWPRREELVSDQLGETRDAHDWFLGLMREHEEFEVETDIEGEWRVPFCSETVRQVVVE